MHGHAAHPPTQRLQSGTQLEFVLRLQQKLLQFRVVQRGQLNFEAFDTADIDLLRRLFIDDTGVVVRLKHALADALTVDDQGVERPVWLDTGLIVEGGLGLRRTGFHLKMWLHFCCLNHLLLNRLRVLDWLGLLPG